ncbi:molybdopterin-dependent oxidoreductase [Azospirillum sp. B506]|uniref:molybdopterin-dependent oxidoreductase n=1 Tax=Azospirillum sp. B506 TaxID=137721 RepID=UPI001FCAD1A8|nr:molybdopterin-dependent oxidoreductase [Azospirillum sp. B506]
MSWTALPTATTSYERNDIEQVGNYALSHIVPMKKIVDPVFEARSDFDIFAAIADKLGKGYAFTQGLSEMDWIRGIYEAAKIESRAKGMEMPVFDVFWDSNKPLDCRGGAVQRQPAARCGLQPTCVRSGAGADVMDGLAVTSAPSPSRGGAGCFMTAGEVDGTPCQCAGRGEALEAMCAST